MRRLAIITLLSGLVGLAVPGCGSPGPTVESASLDGASPTMPEGRQSELDHGYALLLDLLKDEARVSQILAIKQAPAGVRSLLKRISATASTNLETIEGLLDAAPAVSPAGTGLPRIEVAARDRIAEEQTSVLLTSGGDTFIFRMLLTQDKASDYAAALANSLARRDPNAARRKACSALAKDWSLLGRNVRAQLRRLAPVEMDAAASTRVVPGTPTP